MSSGQSRPSWTTISRHKMRCYSEIERRGFIYQATDEKLKEIIDGGKAVFYAGFDPTADSLHVGHLLPIMLIRQLQNAGNIPIILVGGATALIGDPSGKQEARPILSKESVNENACKLKEQLSRFIDISEGRAIFADNYDWFRDMLFIDFLRDVGHRFSVNKMLTAESVKQRLETGISYLEFSYMLLQAYDFFVLNKKHNCTLQIGGQDQWGNIVAGIDLVRRMSSCEVYGMTSPLLLNSQGEKFGKTAAGAVWLDEKKTPVFDYYQFWRNTPDTDVARLMKLFTFLPSEEVERLGALQPPQINRAKEILAFEATALAHGLDVAEKIFLAVSSQFGQADPEGKIETSSAIKNIKAQKTADKDLPVFEVDSANFADGGNFWIVKLLSESGLCSSNGEARRLIKGGGAYINDVRIPDENYQITLKDFKDGAAIVKAGKKNIKKIKIV